MFKNSLWMVPLQVFFRCFSDFQNTSESAEGNRIYVNSVDKTDDSMVELLWAKFSRMDQPKFVEDSL